MELFGILLHHIHYFSIFLGSFSKFLPGFGVSFNLLFPRFQVLCILLRNNKVE